MKIEVGKIYRTRGNLRAQVLAHSGEKKNQWIGAIEESDDSWIPFSWHEKGFAMNPSQPNRTDIVSEWEAPKPRLRGFIDSKTYGVYLVPENADATELYHCARASWLDEPESPNPCGAV